MNMYKVFRGSNFLEQCPLALPFHPGLSKARQAKSFGNPSCTVFLDSW